MAPHVITYSPEVTLLALRTTSLGHSPSLLYIDLLSQSGAAAALMSIGVRYTVLIEGWFQRDQLSDRLDRVSVSHLTAPTA
ncbi:hypothetical protein MWL52_01930 [Escherichia coli]|nr:hypothetical protein [Escherichia coli]